MRVSRAVDLFDLEAYVDEHFSDYKSTKDPSIVRVKCPVCSDWKPRLYINMSEKLFFCHNCGYDPKGLVKFLSDVEGKSKFVVIQELLRLIRPSDSELDSILEALKNEDVYVEEEDSEPLPLKKAELPKYIHRLWTRVKVRGPVAGKIERLQKDAKAYLKERLVPGPLAFKNELYVCYAGPMKNRIIFPVIMNGVCVSWVARAIYNTAGMKYMNPRDVDQGRVLWGFDNARIHSEVVVCEGVFDALRAGDNAVVAFGKNVTHNHVDLIERNWSRVVLLLDPDALAKTYSIAAQFTIPVRIALLDPGTDAGDTDPADLRNVIQNAPAFRTDDDFAQQVTAMMGLLDA